MPTKFIGKYLLFSSLGLGLGEDYSQRYQDTGTQCKEAVFLMLRFSLGQQMGGAYINEGTGGECQQSAQKRCVIEKAFGMICRNDTEIRTPAAKQMK